MKLDRDSYAYKKYVKRYDPDAPENVAKRKMERAAKRKEWWKNNWIALLSMLIAAIALVVSIIGLRLSILALPKLPG